MERPRERPSTPPAAAYRARTGQDPVGPTRDEASAPIILQCSSDSTDDAGAANTLLGTPDHSLTSSALWWAPGG